MEIQAGLFWLATTVSQAILTEAQPPAQAMILKVCVPALPTAQTNQNIEPRKIKGEIPKFFLRKPQVSGQLSQGSRKVYQCLLMIIFLAYVYLIDKNHLEIVSNLREINKLVLMSGRKENMWSAQREKANCVSPTPVLSALLCHIPSSSQLEKKPPMRPIKLIIMSLCNWVYLTPLQLQRQAS